MKLLRNWTNLRKRRYTLALALAFAAACLFGSGLVSAARTQDSRPSYSNREPAGNIGDTHSNSCLSGARAVSANAAC
jgi:cytochrome oxidase Cu insertion factor (SCO1/SenC/PrrC family)